MEPESKSPPTEGLPAATGRERRIEAHVALALLEALRELDRPLEVLDDEDVSYTLPRRFGLSSVVLTQIRRYEEDARRKRRVSQSEMIGLVRLVARRPDAPEVFRQVGRSLTRLEHVPVWRRVLPSRVALLLAGRRLERRLSVLFGRRFARVKGRPFRVVVAHNFLVEGDPEGNACSLVTGLAKATLEAHLGNSFGIAHTECRGKGADECVWVLQDTVPGGVFLRFRRSRTSSA